MSDVKAMIYARAEGLRCAAGSDAHARHVADLAEREKERAAWTRLVVAVETRWREDFQGAAQCDYQREIDAAKAELAALGVDPEFLRAVSR